MNGRKLFREYAQKVHGKEAKEFVRIENNFYNEDVLVTKDNNRGEERCIINYKDLVYWIIKNKSFDNQDVTK